MKTTQLYQRAFAVNSRRRKTGEKADADTNDRTITDSVQKWRKGVISEAELRSNLARIIRGETVEAINYGENPETN